MGMPVVMSKSLHLVERNESSGQKEALLSLDGLNCFILHNGSFRSSDQGRIAHPSNLKQYPYNQGAEWSTLDGLLDCVESCSIMISNAVIMVSVERV